MPASRIVRPPAGHDEQRRAEIGLLDDQERRRQHDEPHDHELRERRRQAPLVHEPRAHHRHGELQQLRRLERDDAEVEPALRAFADLPLDGDRQQQADAEQIQPRREDAQVVRRNLRDHEERREAYAEPHALANEQPALGGDRRCRARPCRARRSRTESGAAACRRRSP